MKEIANKSANTPPEDVEGFTISAEFDRDFANMLIEFARQHSGAGLGGFAPDQLHIKLITAWALGVDRHKVGETVEYSTVSIATHFYALPKQTIGFVLNDKPIIFGIGKDGTGLEDPHRQIQKRNEAAAFTLPEVLREFLEQDNAARGISKPGALPKPKTMGEPAHPLTSSATYAVHTSQEWTELLNAASDGKSGQHLTPNEQKGAIRHQRPGASFYSEVLLSDEEREAGHNVDFLMGVMNQRDIDDGIMCLYISHLLAPPGPLPDYASATAWIDLDDVARKTMGGYAPNPAELAQRRARVYDAIRWGARLYIGGKRSITYREKQTNKEIETDIYTTPWQVVSRQEVTQQPPLRVELVASRQWTALTTHPEIAQYLPFGEILGAIPASQPGGAWARALGLSYFNWCRWHQHEALRGETPSRQQLLDHHPAKKAPYQEVLGGSHPSRALDHWKAAEDYLREGGIIETPAKQPKPQQREGWKADWLSQSPAWKPGPHLKPVLEDLAKNLFQPKPRELNPAKRRPGRPRKASK